MLLRSQPGLKYSHFAVFAPPDAPAKIACIAEGNFSLIASSGSKVPTGGYLEPHPELTFAKFVAPLLAQVQRICA